MAGFIQVPVDGAGKMVDGVPLTDAGVTVYRQKLVVTGGSGTAEVVVVTNAAPSATDMGLVVRQAGTVDVAVATGTFNLSGTAVVSGNVNISTMPSVVLAAGTNVFGTLNNISRTVIVAGVVSLGAGTNLIGAVSLAAGTANFGTLNDISRTVQVAIGTPFILQGISTTVQVAIATPFIIQGISTTVTTGLSYVIEKTSNSQVQVGDSANAAIRVNVVAGSAGGPSMTDNTTYSTGASLVAPAGYIFFSASATAVTDGRVAAARITGTRSVHSNLRTDGGVAMDDSSNSALRVNVVAGAAGGVSQTDGTTFTTQAATFVPIGGIFDDASPDTLSENDAGIVRLTTNRAIHANLRTDGGVKLDDSTNSALRVNIVAIDAPSSVFTDGNPFTAQVTPIIIMGGVFDDATPGTLSENDAGAVRLTTNRAMHVNIRDSAGTELGGASATGVFIRTATVVFAAGVTVNNISAAVAVTGTVSLGAGTNLIGAVSLAAGTANIGFINNISATVVVSGLIGLTAGTAVIGDINAISRTVQVAIATPFILQGISTTVTVVTSANIANDASVTAGTTMLMMGIRSNISAPAVVANGDATYLWGDQKGRLVVAINHPAILPSASHGPKCVTCSTSAGIALIAAPGAGLAVYITKIACTNGSGTLTRADVFQVSATASCMCQMYMAASGGGFTMDYNPPVQVQSNTGVTCRVKPSVSQAIFNVHFYVGPK